MTSKAKQISLSKTNIAVSSALMLVTACLFYFLSSSSVFAQTTTLPSNEQDVLQNQSNEQKVEERVSINNLQKSEAQSDSFQCNISAPLERGGLDKASEHLQILQQTSLHFVDTFQVRKPTSVDKKLQSKPQSNS